MLNHKTQLIRKAKQIHLDKVNKILQQSSFNDKLSWRLIKKHKNTSSINNIPPLNHNSKTVLDPTEKAEVLHSVLCHPDPPKLEPKHITFHNKINQKANNIISTNTTTICTDFRDILNSPIKYYEPTKFIHSLDNDKAYGPDLIHNQMLKNGGPTLWKNLLKLFNKCLKTGQFPQVWNFANICPIPKTQ